MADGSEASLALSTNFVLIIESVNLTL